MNIIAVALGIGLIIYSISIFVRARGLYRFKKMDPWWLVLIVLVVLFLATYLVFEYYLVTGREIVQFQAVVAQVFLWSAIFALVCAKIFYGIPLESRKIELAVRSANECFLKFGPDTLENLKLITQAAGEILGATCTLYNRKEGEMLVTLSGWQLPADMPRADKGRGHICFDVIAQEKDEPVVVQDLLHTKYAETDPNVRKYNLQTYIGYPVRPQNMAVASLCAVFQKKFEPEPYQLELLKILGKAASVEENRRAAEKALMESSTSYQTLAENLPGIVYRVELEDQPNTIFFNEMHVQLTGYRTEELTFGKVCSIDPLIIAEDRDKVVRMVAEAIEAGRPFEAEYRIKRKDGAIRIFWEKGRPRYNAAYKPIFIDGVIFDVTERKEAESRMREKIDELTKLSRLAEGRELKMIEKEKEVNDLLMELGREPKY